MTASKGNTNLRLRENKDLPQDSVDFAGRIIRKLHDKNRCMKNFSAL